MLILTRKIEQCIAIGGTGGLEQFVKITVLKIENGAVRLGFEADSSVPVHRWEVWERIHSGPPTDGRAEGLDASIVK